MNFVLPSYKEIIQSIWLSSTLQIINSIITHLSLTGAKFV